MLFLTIIILGVVSLQTSNLAMMNGEQNQIQAHFLAKQGLQIAKGIGLTGLKTAFTGCASPCLKGIDSNYQLADPITANTAKTVGGQSFTRKLVIGGSVTKAGNPPTEMILTDAFKVKTIVEWEDATGSHKLSENSHVEASVIVSQ